MKIISLINSKGGVGKTTLSVHIAAYLKKQNKSVLLVDADPQGSLRDWKEAAEKENDFEITIADRKQVLINLPKLIKKSGFDYVIIDTSAKASDLLGVSMSLADVILIPVQPSPYDIWATQDVMQLVNLRKTVNPKILCYLIFNRTMPNTLMSKCVIEDMKTYETPSLNSVVQQRVIYSQSAVSGQTVYEFKNDDAKKEIDNLGLELLEKINANQKES